MVMQEGQQQALYGCSGSVREWGGVAAFISAAAAGDAVGENRPNRRPKQKRTPQRGLGVAQLEKIRLEEQQSGTAVVTSAPSLPGPFSPAMPLPPLPLPSTPFSGASDLNPPATRPVIPIPSAPFCDLLVPAPPPAADAPIVGPPAGLAGHGFLPSLLWNPLDMSPQGVEASNKTFSFPISLQEESSNTIWQPSGPFEWQYQHNWQQQSKHPLPNPSVNPSVSLPLSGVKLRNLEPHSNQSSNNMSKHASPVWPGDEKNVEEMAGMKRPWPFHLDAMADYTNFPCKLPLPPLPFPRADEHSPMNGCNILLDFKPGSTSLRDCSPPSSATFQADGRSLYGNPPEKRSKERSSAPVYGDFLTLGASLPPPALPAAPPKLKQCTGTFLSQYCQDTSSSVPAPDQYHGTTDDVSLRYEGSSRSPQQLPFYSFLPMRSSNQETSLAATRHEDVGSIDLNLKL